MTCTAKHYVCNINTHTQHAVTHCERQTVNKRAIPVCRRHRKNYKVNDWTTNQNLICVQSMCSSNVTHCSIPTTEMTVFRYLRIVFNSQVRIPVSYLYVWQAAETYPCVQQAAVQFLSFADSRCTHCCPLSPTRSTKHTDHSKLATQNLQLVLFSWAFKKRNSKKKKNKKLPPLATGDWEVGKNTVLLILVSCVSLQALQVWAE